MRYFAIPPNPEGNVVILFNDTSKKCRTVGPCDGSIFHTFNIKSSRHVSQKRLRFPRGPAAGFRHHPNLRVYTLHVARCTLHAARCTVHAAPCALHAARFTLHAASRKTDIRPRAKKHETCCFIKPSPSYLVPLIVEDNRY